MSTDASRPQPAYGEYATPEQVARARGMSLDEYERHLATLREPRSVVTPTPSPTDAASAPSPQGQVSPVASARSRNRFVTTVLLSFGLACVLLSIPGLLGLGEGLQAAFVAQGLDAYTSMDLADALGRAAVILQLLLWVATLAGSVALLRRGRAAWWVPLVGGVIAVIAVSVIGIAAMVVDPAFTAYVSAATLTQ